VKSRSQRPAEQRHARSRAVQHIAENPLLRGSLVSMARTCGKAGCHCQQGEKHVSLYLAVRLNNRRRMIYVPPAMENAVRGWVGNAHEVDQLLDFISQQCLADFLHQKEEKLGRSTSAGVRPGKPRRKPP
jgi:Family of unknown function (DUF6788)